MDEKLDRRQEENDIRRELNQMETLIKDTET